MKRKLRTPNRPLGLKSFLGVLFCSGNVEKGFYPTRSSEGLLTGVVHARYTRFKPDRDHFTYLTKLRNHNRTGAGTDYVADPVIMHIRQRATLIRQLLQRSPFQLRRLVNSANETKLIGCIRFARRV